MCLLSLCSRSCLHSALIDEVVATFAPTLIERGGEKTIKPFILGFFLCIHHWIFSSLLQWMLFLPLYFSYVFLSVNFNELLCWHDSSVFMRLFLSTLCCSSFLCTWVFPPIVLFHSCQITGLSVHNAILTLHTLYISLMLSLDLLLSLISSGHALYSSWYLISDMYDRVQISGFLAWDWFAL